MFLNCKFFNNLFCDTIRELMYFLAVLTLLALWGDVFHVNFVCLLITFLV